MKELTVNEVKSAKRTAEAAIGAILSELESVSGMRVNGIDLGVRVTTLQGSNASHILPTINMQV